MVFGRIHDTPKDVVDETASICMSYKLYRRLSAPMGQVMRYPVCLKVFSAN
jgi:hypothetical protein